MTLVIPQKAFRRWQRAIEAVFDAAGPDPAIHAAAEWLTLANARINQQQRQIAALRRAQALKRDGQATP